MLVRKACSSDFEGIRQFYAERLPNYAVSPGDSIYIALDGDSICGAVRLVEEQGVLLLRGMQVSPSHQKAGIGTKLLELLDREIGLTKKRHLSFCERDFRSVGWKAIASLWFGRLKFNKNLDFLE
jgi:GNAT superfamily N-acetyltransferase